MRFDTKSAALNHLMAMNRLSLFEHGRGNVCGMQPSMRPDGVIVCGCGMGSSRFAARITSPDGGPADAAADKGDSE